MSQKIYTDLDIKGNTTIGSIANATTDTDKFLVSDNGLVKYRTGAEMLSDLGVAPGVASNVQHQVKAGVAINKGQAVYVTSADGTNMIVGLASNASEATSSKTMGLLDSTVAINGFANVITEGLLAGLNTIGATAGDPVWLGTGGNLIYGLINKPYAPAHLVFIGIVTRVNASNGEIFVKVQNGFELNEIHDVDLKTTTPVNGDILGFNGTLWVNKTIAAWLGYTPANANGTLNRVSKFTSTGTTLGDSQIFDDGTNVGINTVIPGAKFHVYANNSGASAVYGGTLIVEQASAGSIQILSANTQTQSIRFGDPQNGQIGRLEYSHADNSMKMVTNAGTKLTIDSSGNTIASLSLRAPIFYDLDDTTYYLNPNSTSNISSLLINGATSFTEGSLALGAHGVDEGGQLVLNKATSWTYAAHIDVWHDSLRFLYGTNTATSGVAMSIDLSTKQLILPAYTSATSFTGTAVANLAVDASGNVITVAAGGSSGVSSIIAGTGVSVSSSTGAVTVSIGQSVATSATPSFDQVFTTNNGNGTNLKIGDDAWIGDINAVNTLGIKGQQDPTAGYITFGSELSAKLGRTGTGALTWGGNTIWNAGNDGSGSGLDADLLDGLHASDFALASHTHPYDNYQYWNLKTNGVQRTTITSNGTLDLVAGTNVSLSYGAGGVVTISSTDTNTIYTHPAYTTRSIDTSGAQVIDVFTSDAIGSVTNITTRTMTLADLGYTGATNANFYTLPTATSTILGGVELFSDTVQTVAANTVSATASRTYGLQLNSALQGVVNIPWTDTVYTHPAYTARNIDTSGAQVIDIITSDAIGSVTNITTRTLTTADIGAADASHTHDLVRYSLAAPAFIDTLTTANFRTTLFGSTTNGYQISTSRWNSVPTPLTGLNQYGTMFAWAGSDTQGFIAMDYSAAALIVGGGNGNNINWSRRVLVEQSWTNSKYFDTGGEIYGTRFYDANNSAYYVDPADTTTSANFQSKINIDASAVVDKVGLQFTNGYGSPSISAYYSSIYTTGSLYAGNPAGTALDVLGNGARFNIFYERNNTAYYIDPASTSVLNRLSISFNDATYQSGITVTNTNTGAQAVAGVSMFSGVHSGSINMFSSGYMDLLNQNTTNGTIQFRPKATVSMYIDNVSSTSRVTIGGSNTASHPLRVTQQVSNVSIYADYDIVAYSDQSVKENIRPIENVLDRVSKSRGVLYDRIDSGEKNNIGFIAQELEVEFPELVVTNEDNTKAVKYQNAVAVLFEAVKEQQKQIEELKELVNKLITK